MIKMASIFGLSVFSLALVIGFLEGDFLTESSQIFSLMWGKIMLLDLYIGFAIFSGFLFVLEKRIDRNNLPKNSSSIRMKYQARSFFWILALMTLGNGIALAYLLFRNFQIRDQLSKN